MSTFIRNAHIATMNKACPVASAAVTSGGYFAYVGDEDGARTYLERHPQEELETLDAGGCLVAPGFNDSHIHYLHTVLAKLSVDLTGAASMEDLVGRLRKGLESHDATGGRWLTGEGWNQDFFTEGEHRFPTAEDLDAVSREVPIAVVRACYHVVALNTPAMAALGVDGSGADRFGDFALRRADGAPNGVFTELAMEEIWGRVPAPTLDEMVDLMCQSQKDLFSYGITSIQSDDHHSVPERQFYEMLYKMREAGQDGRLQLRVAQQARLDDPALLRDFFDCGFDGSFGNRHYGLSVIKLMADGTIGAHTAYMRQPYLDVPGVTGQPNYTQEQLDELVAIAHAHNMGAVIHAIGNAAIDMCLDAIEKARRSMPYLRPRHGILHCQITDKDQIIRFRELDVIAYTQPVFIENDLHLVYDRIGKPLGDTSYAWGDFQRIGVRQAFSSDSPVEYYDPLRGIYNAVTRRDTKGAGPYLPEQALSLYESLYNYTAAGAWCSREERIKGKIQPGMLADFIVFDRDILTAPLGELLEAKVWRTYVDGKPVYQYGE